MEIAAALGLTDKRASLMRASIRSSRTDLTAFSKLIEPRIESPIARPKAMTIADLKSALMRSHRSLPWWAFGPRALQSRHRSMPAGLASTRPARQTLDRVLALKNRERAICRRVIRDGHSLRTWTDQERQQGWRARPSGCQPGKAPSFSDVTPSLFCKDMRVAGAPRLNAVVRFQSVLASTEDRP